MGNYIIEYKIIGILVAYLNKLWMLLETRYMYICWNGPPHITQLRPRPRISDWVTSLGCFAARRSTEVNLINFKIRFRSLAIFIYMRTGLFRRCGRRGGRSLTLLCASRSTSFLNAILQIYHEFTKEISNDLLFKNSKCYLHQ